MLTAMTEDDWAIVLQVFRAVRSRRGDKGRDDRKFLEALHYFTVHNITWRALSAEFGHWNSIWKRFWRLSRAGIFEAFFDALAALSESAHLVQMFDSTVARAHVSAAGAKGGQDDQALGRSRGGFSTKIHLKVDLDGLPLAFHLTGGRSQRQPQLRTPARHRTRYFAARRHHRQRLRRQIQSRRRPQARHLSGHSASRDCNRQTRFLPENPLQSAGAHRAGRRQTQALQAHRPSLREDCAQLRFLRRARPRPHLDQIRPHGLVFFLESSSSPWSLLHCAPGGKSCPYRCRNPYPIRPDAAIEIF